MLITSRVIFCFKIASCTGCQRIACQKSCAALRTLHVFRLAIKYQRQRRIRKQGILKVSNKLEIVDPRFDSVIGVPCETGMTTISYSSINDLINLSIALREIN